MGLDRAKLDASLAAMGVLAAWKAMRDVALYNLGKTILRDESEKENV